MTDRSMFLVLFFLKNIFQRFKAYTDLKKVYSLFFTMRAKNFKGQTQTYLLLGVHKHIPRKHHFSREGPLLGSEMVVMQKVIFTGSFL